MTTAPNFRQPSPEGAPAAATAAPSVAWGHGRLDPAAGSWLVPPVRSRPLPLRLLGLPAAGIGLCCVTLLSAQEASQRTAAEGKLSAIQQSQPHRKLARDPVRRAQDALRRGEDARAAGDDHHGQMLEALALEWASMAEALLRTAEMESKVAELQRQAAEAETKSIRAKALLEETAARRGRARAKLEQLEAQGKAEAGAKSAGGKP